MSYAIKEHIGYRAAGDSGVCARGLHDSAAEAAVGRAAERNAAPAIAFRRYASTSGWHAPTAIER